ncbi:aminodeoxychorismate synthase component I [Methylococcus sp. EFPC2]|uniref:aminodeoxychorismate synthase component I n=1 Tax=Methylococcus sp. EFPC2 TaxID=2812648 RepID=UPI00196758E1|nr:aminodeoxychorismate synthase component I [Methylococcus sp. EFPC2]QSA96739.1 aminodeoxychorismate synthase component I [Methylococcus sp. EFPC2]
MSENIPTITELPYFEDSTALFMPWAERRWAAFLDSGFPFTRQGRYDILAAEPYITLVTRGPLTEIRQDDSIRLSPEDPFALIKQALGEPAPALPDIPFPGGAIGYFGYDLARRLERLPELASDAELIPEMGVGVYDWAVVVDHHERRTRLVSLNRDPATAARWPHLVHAFSQIQTLGWQHTGFGLSGQVESNMTRAQYGKAFTRIKQYIREGDCYQVNLAQRFQVRCHGNPWTAYVTLRHVNPAPFSAFLNQPQVQVLSSSPERFLKLKQGVVETKPIKGTRPRSLNPEDDRARIEELRASLKDRAENLMIVDLLRNDIGKSCEPGSVHVPGLFEIESYATVHHLVSTVRGRLAAGRHALDLLRGCFPGGSITGAPKIRAMEIIEELEPNRRGVYCGAIGYIGYDGDMDSNIAIRTLVHSDSRIRFWAGGGIVADSDMEQEYQECYHKAAALLHLLEHFQIGNTGDHVGA